MKLCHLCPLLIGIAAGILIRGTAEGETVSSLLERQVEFLVRPSAFVNLPHQRPLRGALLLDADVETVVSVADAVRQDGIQRVAEVIVSCAK